MWIAAMLVFVGAWLVGQAILDKRGGDINAMGFGLVMACVDFVCMAVGSLWLVHSILTVITSASIP
jgi:hypothetical protein